MVTRVIQIIENPGQSPQNSTPGRPATVYRPAHAKGEQMTTSTVDLPPGTKKFTAVDSGVFVGKLILCMAITGACIGLIVNYGWPASLPAQLGLGMMFAHAIELQHQALHGTGLRSSRANRIVGVLLGIPMLVSFSRYRGLHLLHHRYLGTDRDTEFFSYDTSRGLTLGSLSSSAFNLRRRADALGDVFRSLVPRTRYEPILADALHRRIRREYRLMFAWIMLLTTISIMIGNPIVITLWLIPLLIAEPIHFLIELPEHVLCDRTSRNVFRNTRTVKGSWFSFWLTNGNNFHTEHHYRMGVPINKLSSVHDAIRPSLIHYCDSYPQFYLKVLRHAWHATFPHARRPRPGYTVMGSRP
jgi:fatty acid desaturase